jgi:hypothetical protein
MPFPIDEERIERAERELGRRLPSELRPRLMRDNGGEIAAMPVAKEQRRDFDPYWDLHPVWDDSDQRRAARTASHIVREAAEARTQGAAAFFHDPLEKADRGASARRHSASGAFPRERVLRRRNRDLTIPLRQILRRASATASRRSCTQPRAVPPRTERR